MSPFNPADFTLKEIKDPNDRSTILEWDSTSRLVYVRTLQEDGSYKMNQCFLQEGLNNTILNSFGEEFSNDRDQIVLFGVYDDETYTCIKKRIKYDFNTQSTKTVRYEKKDYTWEQVKELFDVIKAAVWIENTNEIIETENELNRVVSNQKYFDQLYEKGKLELEHLLRYSDYRLLDDNQETIENEKEYWIQWRDAIRDVPNQRSDFESDIDYLIYSVKFRWPKDPLRYHTDHDGDMSQYLQDDDLSSHHTEISSDEENKMRRHAVKILTNKKIRDADGIPIDQKMGKIIEKYSLHEHFLNYDLSTLTITGIEQ